MEVFHFFTLDIILSILLFGFAVWGFSNGFIRAIGGIIGIIIAAFVAGQFYLWLANIVGPIFGPFQAVARIASFAFLFLLIGRLFGFVVLLVERAFDFLAFLPFLKSINRLAGALFGLILGVLVLGTLLYIAGKYSLWTSFNDAVIQSQLAQYLLVASSILRPLFPESVRQLQSYF
ncbi:MAG: CvpA family protein [Patescibacteria group bacterium]|jgi:membrane protein required for colicin V production